MRSMVVFNYLLEATFAGSVIILLIVGVRGLLRERLGSRAIYAAWLVAALRLLLPIALPNPLMDGLRPGLSEDPLARPVADQVRRRLIDVGSTASTVLPGGTGSSMAQLTQGLRGGETGKWVLLIWLAVALLAAAWMAFRQHDYVRMMRRNRVRRLDADEQQTYAALCQRYGVQKPIPAYYVDRIAAGTLAGVTKPFIALPLTLPKEHLPLALSHQLCHYRAHDLWWGAVRTLCCAIHWFNPLVWMAAWLSYRDSEMACDDRVTDKLHDLDRLAYADVIVRTATSGADSRAVGASFTDQHLRERVRAVIRGVRGSRLSIAIGSLAAAVVLVLSFAMRESEPLPVMRQIPEVTWTAGVQSIADEMDAIAAARRFLESPFVGEDTAAYAFTARMTDAGWLVEARLNRGQEVMTLAFSDQGELTLYDGFPLLGDVTFADTSYTHRQLTRSMRSYVDAFVAAEVPGLSYDSGRAIADVRSGDVRLLFGELAAGKQPVGEFAVQVEPVPRMLSLKRIP